MGRKKRTEITVETNRTLVIRRRRTLVATRCERCTERGMMVSVQEAAVLASLSLRTIYALVEAGRVHSTEIQDGGLLICLNSLTAVTSDK